MGKALQSKILLGTSGWSYRDWIGPFYEKGVKSMLSAYSKVFKTAEIDSTFYAYPSKGTVMGWLKYTEPDFVFCAKLPQIITHEKMLDVNEGVEEDVKRFVELMEPLYTNGKLGCILIQLPPKLECNLDLLEKFFDVLPTEVKFAIEFRNASWLNDETFKLLRKFTVAYTIVDEPLLPPKIYVTADFAYFRWHGRGGRPWYNYRYQIEELEPWVPKIKEVTDKVKVVYGYFNNHFHGYAVENCLQVLKMLGKLTPEQAKALEKVQSYYTSLESKPVVERPSLEMFVDVSQLSFDSLLKRFIDEPRLKRAKRIKDDEISIERVGDKTIEARIRDYHIVIDLENQVILHDCADWSRCIPRKMFCKHLGKLFLSLPEEKSIEILRKIFSEKKYWEFKPYAGF